MPFVKGKSGNPSGRPKVNVDLQELARKSAPEAIAALVSVVRHSTNDSAKVAAANALLDRGYGRAHQTVETTVHNVDPATVTDAQLASIIIAESATNATRRGEGASETPSDTKKLN